MKIVACTGSFNPITKGHLLTMECAIVAVGAEKGLFIISPHKYLIKKMLFKSKTPTSFVLSDEKRKEMIESLKLINNKIEFGGVEVGGANPSSVKTFKRILKKNKDTELFVLIGADKLHNLPSWNEIDDIIDNIKILIAVRKGYDIESEIDSNPWLLSHKDKLITIYPNEEAFEISSTEIRRCFNVGEDYSLLMNDGPYKLLQNLNKDDFPELSPDDLIEFQLRNGGRFGGQKARLLVYEYNNNLFHNWDDSILGNKDYQINNTKLYKDEFHLDIDNNYELMTDCVNKDCADVAFDLINEGFNPAILNLASNISPGGGYHKGTNAQEECLCQMSTLSQTLYQYGDPKYKHIRESSVPNKLSAYPLNVNFGGIYSPSVTFFRNNKESYYSLREKKFSCSIITVASLSNRIKNGYTNDERKYFNADGTLTLEGRMIESNKIRTIYRIALDNNHDSIVLGAFGCGVYHLLPSEISQMFFDILNEPEFKGNFKKIVFAIFEGNEKRGKVVGKDGHFKPFYELFGDN